MTVYFEKKRRRWRYDFWRSRIRHVGDCLDHEGMPAASRRAAAEAEGIEKRKFARGAAPPPAHGNTLASTIAELAPVWETQGHWPNRKRYIKELLGFFGPEKPIGAFDAGEVRRYVSFCLTRPVMSWQGGPERDPEDAENAHYWKQTARLRGPNTSNLYLGTLRQILQHAAGSRDPRTGEPLLANPPEVPELAVPKRKARPAPENVLVEILASLPQHAAEAVVLTLFFGFRRSEVFTLEIAQVDFESAGIRLFAEGVKDNEDAFLPGGPEAMAYLRRLVDQAVARGTMRLITWRPYRKDPAEQEKLAWRPVKRAKSAWATAMDAIEKKHGRRWRWHDVRAAFITHVARTSGQLAAQTLARHSEYATTALYVEAADEFRRAAAHRAADRPALALIGGGKSPTSPSHTRETRTRRKIVKPL